ncbi:MAG: galactokinase family protein [Chloroflexota bacterium]
MPYPTTQTAAPPIRMARPEAERIEAMVRHLVDFHDVAPADIRVVKAPFRICPLGAHIDHQLGLVTGMTLDRSILLAFAPTTDGTIQLHSTNFELDVLFDLEAVPAYQRGDWGNYIRGAALALQRHYPLPVGLVGVVSGDLPIGGLSSSAAVTIAYLLALESLNHLEVSPRENVSLVRFTENEYIGLNNGILDQTVILFSEHNHLTLIDCESVEIERVPAAMPEQSFEILAVYSGLSHALVGTDYNNRVAECQEAAGLLLGFAGRSPAAGPRLRQVDPEIFAAEGHRLPPLLRRRATHYFGEMQRVIDGVAAWRQGNLSEFGALMNRSGESSIKYYECGSPQLITLYNILRQTPGVYGTRFSGAGFRGNCIALIDPAARESIAETIHRHYPAAHPAEAEKYTIHFCRPDGRAHLTSWSR